MKAIDAILFDPDGILTDEQGTIYEDAAPALAELARLGVTLITVTSVSDAALTKAVADASLDPRHVIFLTGSEAGIRAAKQAGIQPILMMNDPDEAMRLTAFEPAGGIVSLHELPDFVRFLLAKDSRQRQLEPRE